MQHSKNGIRTGGKILAVIVTHNSAAVVPGLLESLEAGFGGHPYDVVVADNNSADETIAVVSKIAPDAVVFNTGGNGGYAAGINAAVRRSPNFAALLVLNPDVRLHPHCVSHLLVALSHPATGISVPRLSNAHGELIESIRREPKVFRAFAEVFLGVRRAGRIGVLGETVTDTRHYDADSIVDWAEGSIQLISADCWQQCGPWDESFFLYSEETEFDLRARDAGWLTRFTPSATATHLEGDSSPALWSILVVNRVRLFSRRNGRSKTCAFWLATWLREVSRAILGQKRSKSSSLALLRCSRFRESPGPRLLSSETI